MFGKWIIIYIKAAINKPSFAKTNRFKFKFTFLVLKEQIW